MTILFSNYDRDPLELPDEDRVMFGVLVEDLSGAYEESTLEEYVEMTLGALEATIPGFELVSRQRTETSQGLPAERLEFTEFGGDVRSSRLIYLHEGTIGFSATYQIPESQHDELKSLVDYSFGAFRVGE